MHNLKKTFSKKEGYSLAELAISTGIIALLAIGGLEILERKNISDAITSTDKKLATINHALDNFIRTHGYVPCPAKPNLSEGNNDFGQAAPTYNTETGLCSRDIENQAGTLPVRTLNLPDSYSYDGWNRKFSYKIANAAANHDDFIRLNYRGDIRIINLEGQNKTPIDETPPYNEGAIYVIISHGSNGESSAWPTRAEENDPSNIASRLAAGMEQTNTDHSNNTYIQDKKSYHFDDIISFALKSDIIQNKIIPSPIQFDRLTCNNAHALVEDGPEALENYINTTNQSISAEQADAIFTAAEQMVLICNNATISTLSTPTDLANLQLWLDSQDHQTLFTDSDCVVPIGEDGDSIQCWQDKSSYQRHAIATLGTHPTYAEKGINFHPAINYTMTENSSATLKLSNSPIYATGEGIENGMTILFVTRTDTTTSGTGTLYHSGDDQDHAIHLALKLENMNSFLSSLSLPNTPALQTVSPAVSTHIISSTIEFGTQQTLSINGREIIQGTNNLTALTHETIGNGDTTIGGMNNHSPYIGNSFQGHIGEVLVYNKALKRGGDLNQLELYLADKWNITLPAEINAQNCRKGMVLRTDKTDPIGGCHCPEGQELITNTLSTTACHNHDSLIGTCLSVKSAPHYAKPPPTSDLRLWLDGNDCTTIILNEKKEVSQWLDKSSRNNHAISPNSHQPVYQYDGINGKAALQFDSANSDHLTIGNNNLIDFNDNFSIFIVTQPFAATDTGKQTLVSKARNTEQQQYSFSLLTEETLAENTLTNVPQFYVGYETANNNQGLPSNYTLTYDKPYVLSAIISNATNPEITTYVNGLLTSQNLFEKTTDTGLDITIGGDGGTIHNHYFTGNIAEILLYGTALGESKRTEVENYLGHKWGITMTSPLIGSGLKLWLDSNDANTIFSSSDCITGQGPQNNTAIGCWKDKSLNGYDAKQDTIAQRPVYRTQQIHDLPSINFTGNGQHLTLANQPITGNLPRSLFVVGKTNSNKGADNTFLSLSNHTGAGSSYDLTAEIGIQVNNGYSIFNRNLDNGSYAILSIESAYASNVATSKAWLNGLALEATASNNQFINTGTGIAYIGKSYNSINSTLDGNIAEIMLYEAELPPQTRQDIESYLADKWGIPILHAPGGVAHGLQLWLDSTDPKANNISANSPASLTQWTDKSSYNHHAHAAGNPILITADDYPLVYFNGAASYYQISDLPPFQQAEIFAVLKTDKTPQTLTNKTGLWLMGIDNDVATYPSTDNFLYDHFASNRLHGPFPLPQHTALTNLHLYNVISTPQTWQQRINGQALQPTETNTVTFPDTIILGKSAGEHYFTGAMGEIILYNRDTGEDRPFIECYLADKWNITVAGC